MPNTKRVHSSSIPLEASVSYARYCGDEKVLTLKDADTSGVDVIFHGRKSLSADGNLTRAKAALLNDIGLKMGLIDEPLPFPVVEKEQPKTVNWEKLNNNPEGHSRLPAGDYAVKWYNDSIVEAGYQSTPNTEGLERAVLDETSTFRSKVAQMQTESLKSHLKAGHHAIIFTKGKTAKWIDVPNYYLSEEWLKANEDFESKIEAFVSLKERIRKAEEFDAALAQHYRLKDIPFEWAIGVKLVSKDMGGRNADMERSSTVTHIVVKEHFKEGRLERKPNDFYCTGRLSQKDTLKSDYSYSVAVDGMVVKKIPHLITCKTCNDRINKLLEVTNQGG